MIAADFLPTQVMSSAWRDRSPLAGYRQSPAALVFGAILYRDGRSLWFSLAACSIAASLPATYARSTGAVFAALSHDRVMIDAADDVITLAKPQQKED